MSVVVLVATPLPACIAPAYIATADPAADPVITQRRTGADKSHRRLWKTVFFLEQEAK